MAKNKTVYVCSECGQDSPKWVGRCPSCGQWNTMKEMTIAAVRPSDREVRTSQALGGMDRHVARPVWLSEVKAEEEPRFRTSDMELDRVLGGGIVLGGVVLLSGEPGVGKSTMLLQLCGAISNQHTVLYITGEESVRQVKLRAARLKIPQENIYLVAENDVDEI